MASIKDVANMAGVSVAAVSKYFKTPQNMREDTKEKISSAINSLNYSPNPLAQSLRTGKTNIIGIAISEIENPYFTAIFELLQSLCEKQGLLAMVFKSANDKESARIADILKSGLVDGIICYDEGQADLFANDSGIPTVKMGPISKSDYPAKVEIDFAVGIKKLCSHLEQSGVKRLGYIGPNDNDSSAQKISAVKDCCVKCGLSLDKNFYITDCYTYLEGYDACLNYIKSGAPLPDAIIAESDVIAVGVLKALNECGVKVPQDVKLSGCDNTYISKMSNPAITSVTIPVNEMCTAAMDMLCCLMAGEPILSQKFKTDLVIRESTL